MRVQRLVLAFVGAALAAFLVLPLAALVTTSSPSDVVSALRQPSVAAAARLSVVTSVVTAIIVVIAGTPLAWMLVQQRGRLARVVETLLQLPVVVPPAVAGVALLLTFGRHGVLAPLSSSGFTLAFTTAAVVLAQVFVAAPLYVHAAIGSFRRIDPALIVVARTFGARPLRVLVRVAVPLAAPGLVGGAVMCWARALGEFGATLMFAGNLAGRTQTLPLAIYTAFEADVATARALAIVLVVVAVVVLVFVHVVSRHAIDDGRVSR